LTSILNDYLAIAKSVHTPSMMASNTAPLKQEILKNIEINCTHFNLRKASRSVTQYYNEALRASGLEINQFTLLTAISLYEPIGMTALAQEIVMDRTTLTRDLKPLERRGLITIKPGQDKRMRLVSTTKAGKTALAEAIPLWEAAQTATIESLGLQRWTSLLTELKHVVSLT
jgi:DNA-binding MarR family transcriptional regulator